MLAIINLIFTLDGRIIMAYIKRAVEDTIIRISSMFPVLLVTGPRQVGKTTLLQKLADEQRSEGVERKFETKK